MNTDLKTLLAELLRIADDYHPDRNEDCPLALSQMREAVSELAERLLAQPEPEGLTDEELMAVFWQGAGLSGAGTGDHILRGLRAVLARWGADTELEACCELLDSLGGDGEMIRRYRRPKPPSLKRVALLQLDTLNADLGLEGKGIDLSQIRRALEALPDD